MVIPINVFAATHTVTLGEAGNQHAGGSISGTLIIGDETVQRMMVNEGATQVDDYYITQDGLQALAYVGCTTTSAISYLQMVEDVTDFGNIQNVIVYVGINNILNGQDYSDYVQLIDLIKTKFNNPKVYVHRVYGINGNYSYIGEYTAKKLSEFNTWINSITNVSIVNHFNSNFTDGSFQVSQDSSDDGKHLNSDRCSEWYEQILFVYGNKALNETLSYVENSTSDTVATLAGLNLRVTEHDTTETEGEIENPMATFFPTVTALHSVNAAIAADGGQVYYIPELKDIPMDMKAMVESGQYNASKFYHGFAAVYDKTYDLEAHTQQQSASTEDGTIYYTTTPEVYNQGKAMRSLEVLGYDFLLENESCTFDTDSGKLRATYKTEILKNADDTPKFKTIVMNVYKALGESCYTTQIAFSPDSSMTPETSPLQSDIGVMLGNGDVAWDNSEGACWIFNTRSNVDRYWSKANKDKIITTIRQSSPTFVGFNTESSLTVGEFCIFLKEMMVLYGEPILTDTEQKLLLQVYGKDIPFYMSDRYMLSAIEYLCAKGILDIDNLSMYEWSSTLTRDIMLDMLMAVYDTNSRYTFKDVDMTIDPTLSDLGYFPTETTNAVNPVEDVEYGVENNDLLPEYDFLIKSSFVNDEEFSKVNIFGSTINEPIYVDTITVKKTVTTTTNETNTSIQTEITDLTYYWYHVSFPINTPTVRLKGEEFDTGDIPAEGGILYKRKDGTFDLKPFDKYAQENIKTKTNGTKVTTIYDIPEYLIDKDRTNKANTDDGLISDSIYLAKKSGIKVAFTVKKSNWETAINGITLHGVSLNANNFKTSNSSKVPSKGKVQEIKKNNTYKVKYKRLAGDAYTFEVSGFKKYNEFKSAFKYKTGSGVKKYKTFAKEDNKYCLINADMLKDMGIVSDIQQINDTLLAVSTSMQTIYLSTIYNYVVVGNCVYQSPSDVILFMKMDDGDMYIDYRSVIGWAREYLVLRDTDNGLSVNFCEQNNIKTMKDCRIYTFQNNNSTNIKCQMYERSSNDRNLLLTSNYPLANYVLFIADGSVTANGADNDILFVFKRNDVVGVSKYGDNALSKSESFLHQYLGVSLNKDSGLCVCAYPLERTTKNGGRNKNPPGIKYYKDYGYVWKLDKSKEKNYYKRYYKSVESNGSFIGELSGKNWTNQIVIPIAKCGDKFVDFNLNTYIINGEQLPYGTVPGDIATGVAGYGIRTYSVKNGILSEIKDNNKAGMANKEIIPAPTGITSLFVDIGKTGWGDIGNSGQIYYGTLRMDYTEPNLSFYSGGQAYAVKGDDVVFKPLRLSSDAQNKIYGVDTVLGMALDGEVGKVLESKTMDDGNELEKFDWSTFKLKNIVEDMDDFLTIGTIGILSIIPRIALYLCIAMIVLSLIANVKIVQKFSDNVIDIYSILTLKRKNVHTIDTRSVFFSSLLGISIFWLFLDGTIIRVISWFIRAVIGISIR